MAEDKNKTKEETPTEEAPKASAEKTESVEVNASTSPLQNKNLPQGIYGGPATADNPPEANVVIRAEDRS